jgi:hypothetical protein
MHRQRPTNEDREQQQSYRGDFAADLVRAGEDFLPAVARVG